MHACMQFDVYLIDPHYTEKVAICCVDDKLNYSLYSYEAVNMPTNMPIATGDFK